MGQLITICGLRMKHFIVVKYFFICIMFTGLLPLNVLASTDDANKCNTQVQALFNYKYNKLGSFLSNYDYQVRDEFCKFISERDIRIGELENQILTHKSVMDSFMPWVYQNLDLHTKKLGLFDHNIPTLATRLDAHAKLISALERHGEIPAAFHSYGEWITSNELSRTDKEKELEDMIKKMTERIESLEKKIGGKKRVDRLDKME